MLLEGELQLSNSRIEIEQKKLVISQNLLKDKVIIVLIIVDTVLQMYHKIYMLQPIGITVAAAFSYSRCETFKTEQYCVRNFTSKRNISE